MVERDREVAERVEEELRRLHDLDRRRRHSIGAAETNLAALRERVRSQRGGVNKVTLQSLIAHFKYARVVLLHAVRLLPLAHVSLVGKVGDIPCVCFSALGAGHSHRLAVCSGTSCFGSATILFNSQEVHRAKFARARPDASRVTGMDSSQRPGKRRPEDGHVDTGARRPPPALQVNSTLSNITGLTLTAITFPLYVRKTTAVRAYREGDEDVSGGRIIPQCQLEKPSLLLLMLLPWWSLCLGQIDGSGRRNWPAWWPIPPPHPISHVSNGAGAMPDGTSRPGTPPQAARPSTQLMAQELERLRLLQNTRQKLFRAAHRAGDQGRGRAATPGEIASSSKGRDSPLSPCPPPPGIAPTWPISTSAAAAAAAETAIVGDDDTTTAVSARPVSIFAPALHPRTGGTTTTLRVPSSSGLMPGEVASRALPREPSTASSDVSSMLRSPPAKHPSYSSQRHSSDVWGMPAATTAYSGRVRREASEEKVASDGIPAAGAPPALARPPTARMREGGRNQQYSDESLLSEGDEEVEVSGDVSDDDGKVAVSEARRGMRTVGAVRIPLARQVITISGQVLSRNTRALNGAFSACGLVIRLWAT